MGKGGGKLHSPGRQNGYFFYSDCGTAWRSEGSSGQQLYLPHCSPAREDSEKRARVLLYLEPSTYSEQHFLIETHTLSKNQCPLFPFFFFFILFWMFQSHWGAVLAIQLCVNLIAHAMSSICVCSRQRQKQCWREPGPRTSCFCRICELIALSHILLSFCFNQAKMLPHKREKLPWRMLNNSYSRWIILPTHRCDLFMRWYQESMSSVKGFVFKSAKKNIFKGL